MANWNTFYYPNFAEEKRLFKEIALKKTLEYEVKLYSEGYKLLVQHKSVEDFKNTHNLQEDFEKFAEASSLEYKKKDSGLTIVYSSYQDYLVRHSVIGPPVETPKKRISKSPRAETPDLLIMPFNQATATRKNTKKNANKKKKQETYIPEDVKENISPVDAAFNCSVEDAKAQFKCFMEDKLLKYILSMDRKVGADRNRDQEDILILGGQNSFISNYDKKIIISYIMDIGGSLTVAPFPYDGVAMISNTSWSAKVNARSFSHLLRCKYGTRLNMNQVLAVLKDPSDPQLAAALTVVEHKELLNEIGRVVYDIFYNVTNDQFKDRDGNLQDKDQRLASADMTSFCCFQGQVTFSLSDNKFKLSKGCIDLVHNSSGKFTVRNY